MGGVWLPRVSDARQQGGSRMTEPVIPIPQSCLHTPILWRAKFPTNIQSELVTHSNPGGTLTNSDLELAGTIAHADILSHTIDTRESTIHILSDNTPAVAWQTKGSTTTTKAPAYLLRLQALHQRHYRYCPTYSHIPGPANAMADDCSRLWYLDDSALLTHFNSTYPQATSWTLCHLRPEMHSALISSCFGHRNTPALYLVEPVLPTSTGIGGLPSAKIWPKTNISTIVQTQSPYSKSSATDTAPGPWPPAVNRWELERWKTSSVRWARRSPDWGPLTHA
jgi:hypothetical protein